jgi:outer membrane biogenesis lipoprotein LolB
VCGMDALVMIVEKERLVAMTEGDDSDGSRDMQQWQSRQSQKVAPSNQFSALSRISWSRDSDEGSVNFFLQTKGKSETL